jgi:hypothetical protein
LNYAKTCESGLDTAEPVRTTGATILAIFILLGTVIILMVGAVILAASGYISGFLS